MKFLPISDYALLSNCHTSALVSRSGSVDWLPFPRFDSPSIFAGILDEKGGHYSIAALHAKEITRKYIDNTLCLQTTFQGDQGEVILEDLLAVGPNDTGHELGQDAPRALIRRVRCTRGSADVHIEYAPWPEYGLILPILKQTGEGILAVGGSSVVLLSSPVRFNLFRSIGWADIPMSQGDEYYFVLEHSSTDEAPPSHWTREKAVRYFQGTIAAWESWSSIHQNYQGPWKEMVWLSGRILQALTYYPTGAFVAAPTTSLPEAVGGMRNWDYRYSWIRDASFTLNALWVAACPDEAYKFFNFIAGATFTNIEQNQDIQIVFGIGGEHDLNEHELSYLSGWNDSSPVRVGNEAWKQRQIDVYGELLDAVYRLKDYLQGIDDITREVLRDIVDIAAARWKDKDHGIWEMRAPEQDFLYSKLMCWVALDRAIAIADLIKAEDRVSSWEAGRELIREAILTHAWNEKVGAFTQYFGSDNLDASALMMPIVGFIEADDPRMLSTISAIERNLTDSRGLVYRYKSPDGLEGEEGPFLLCTFWLSHALALAGRTEHARSVFERALAFANDLGLFSEGVDPHSNELIGNYPQAFTHIGLINAAWEISLAEGSQHRA
ncbi:MAG TPA: glycoside hydrolase family 15 protein [Deltaproteobacteria bacterium]|jgi:GH15 family glucan-1,4-alpha-glucosidase|nr:glycoside hydrolase family 15 protein [Deltaproteobacteria bacterium]HQJ07466.1 glycoside hydrolase family 15 protein [Deltaproteobacteria bacterium]